MASFRTSAIFQVVLAGAMLATAAAWGQPQPQPTMLVEPPTPLLRTQAGDLNTPTVLQKTAVEATDDLFDRPGCGIELSTAPMTLWHGPCLAILKEDGLTRLAGADYGRVQVYAFQFGDATGAYSAYTFYRSLMKSPHLIGAEARMGNGSTETSADASGTLVWAGTTVLKLVGRVSKEELAAVVGPLPKVGGSKGLAPLLPTELIKDGLESESVRYAVGTLAYQNMGGVLPATDLGWDKSLETATASYTGKGGSHGILTLLMYPTPQIAGDRGRAIEQAVASVGADKFGTLRMRRVGPMIGVTSGAFTARQADALIAALKLDQVVTFDKKKPLEFHAEVRKTASLLQNIAVLSGVLILAAVLLGLFLGLGRAWIRVLMGKPAASEPEFLTINLRDKPKGLFVPKDSKPE